MIPTNVASAALAAGLPSSSVEQFVGYIMVQNSTAAANVSGVTPTIVEAAAKAVLDTYATAFRYVWLSAIPFLVLAVIGMF